jgi:Cip1-like, core domain
MLSVPVPKTFWARLYMRSDVDIGQEGHNAYFAAMTALKYSESTNTVEFSEQFNCVQLNEHDSLYPMSDSSGKTCAGPALPKNTWHCLEAMYDGATGNVQIYANGTKIVDAMGWARAKATFANFEFGFADYHGPGRNVWYDDVAVGPSRIGCE